MVWYAWVVVVLLSLNIPAWIYLIGKPRRTVTHGHAIYQVVVILVLIATVVSVATH